MNEEPPESPVPGIEPVLDNVGPTTAEKPSSKAERPSKATPSHEPIEPSDSLPTKETRSFVPIEKSPEEVNKEEGRAAGGEPPADWLEPLEDDEEEDANSYFGRNDAEEESLAGESERSESVAGSEKAFKKKHRIQVTRRKRSHPDEGWEEWTALGEGWKRKEVVRRSGSSIGQKDVYYMSPKGDRVRSRVELVSVLEGVLDLSTYDYKSGKFQDGKARPIRIRQRVKKKIRERSSSESSFMERGEGADTPDSYHRLTPNLGPKNAFSNQTGFSTQSIASTPKLYRNEDLPWEDRIKLPLPSSSKPLPLPSINGEIGTEESTLVCARCGISFTGTWYDKQRKRPCCPSCWAASKTKEHPMIRFRKGPGSGGLLQQRSYNDVTEGLDDTCMSFKSEFADSQHQSLKSSDTENFSVNVDVEDDDDMSTDDDDDWHRKRKRRSCGECNACLCRKDCGTCDFCVDKPKFGGSNKKRQKCRLRQCQRQAMRHLLPFQMGQGDFGPDGPMTPGRPRPHYTYSRKSNLKQDKGQNFGLDFTDNEDDDFQPISWSTEPARGSKHSELNPLNYSNPEQHNGLSDRVPRVSHHNYSQLDQQSRCDAERSHSGRYGQKPIEDDDHDDDDDDDEDDEEEEEDLPMITQIFSLAGNAAGSGTDIENQLMKLLHSLRISVLPILWYAIMVEGPQLQLIQCSKLSNMADTMVLIDPGFFYQVTVQKQPLLPTHPLYDNYPACLTSVTDVVNLLLGLEKYAVCQGLSPKESSPKKDPIVLERASTCDFLVKRNVSICNHCRALQEL
ncbi:methyl-CpG-binding domain protein 1b isoform X2 [Platichthys flesus]|uniref:methyl-CpG-binding domain protein 1b isoform X2 n=1 Tax=Platichthys flesus TaxID=8260 RepID=UPI002DBB34E7|nr:methyl-CpG-binding domain protein 1b isoform X2 [Platichthys flesus]